MSTTATTRICGAAGTAYKYLVSCLPATFGEYAGYSPILALCFAPSQLLEIASKLLGRVGRPSPGETWTRPFTSAVSPATTCRDKGPNYTFRRAADKREGKMTKNRHRPAPVHARLAPLMSCIPFVNAFGKISYLQNAGRTKLMKMFAYDKLISFIHFHRCCRYW